MFTIAINNTVVTCTSASDAAQFLREMQTVAINTVPPAAKCCDESVTSDNWREMIKAAPANWAKDGNAAPRFHGKKRIARDAEIRKHYFAGSDVGAISNMVIHGHKWSISTIDRAIKS